MPRLPPSAFASAAYGRLPLGHRRFRDAFRTSSWVLLCAPEWRVFGPSAPAGTRSGLHKPSEARSFQSVSQSARQAAFSGAWACVLPVRDTSEKCSEKEVVEGGGLRNEGGAYKNEDYPLPPPFGVWPPKRRGGVPSRGGLTTGPSAQGFREAKFGRERLAGRWPLVCLLDNQHPHSRKLDLITYSSTIPLLSLVSSPSRSRTITRPH